MSLKFIISASHHPSQPGMSEKTGDLLKSLLQKKQQAQQWRQADKPANKLTNKQNRWQRFNRYVWDKKQG